MVMQYPNCGDLMLLKSLEIISSEIFREDARTSAQNSSEIIQNIICPHTIELRFLIFPSGNFKKV